MRQIFEPFHHSEIKVLLRETARGIPPHSITFTSGGFGGGGYPYPIQGCALSYPECTPRCCPGVPPGYRPDWGTPWLEPPLQGKELEPETRWYPSRKGNGNRDQGLPPVDRQTPVKTLPFRCTTYAVGYKLGYLIGPV